MKKWIVLVLCFAFAKANCQEISPQTKIVDFEQISAALSFKYEAREVSGQMVVTFKMLENADGVYLDGVNMTVEDKTPDIEITATDTQIFFKGDFKQGQNYTAFFDYMATPKQTLYFVDNQGSPQIWTQGQGKYTSHWLPSIDDMNDKIEFDLAFIERSGKRVISNGFKDERNGSSTPNGHDMKNPISSYLVALAIGDYDVKKETSTSGVPLEYYYYPQDSLKVEPTYRYSKQIFDFMEAEIAVPYPWQVYKQVPVKDFLYAGMENASCTIFSDDFMVDAIGFNDRNYVNVNAHELAHQWFGDLVTETKSDHHWLHEGFATYYSLLAEREIFGDDYFYYKLFESAEQLRALSDQGKGQQLVAAGGSSLTYYQKGAWAVHILREMVGEDAFAKAVKAYLLKHAYKNVTTSDFMEEVALVTNVDLDNFKKNWLYQKAFQAQDALESLKKSAFMRQYFELQLLRLQPLSAKFEALMQAIDSGNEYLGQEGVYQLAGEPIEVTKGLVLKAIESNNLYIKQAAVNIIEPEDLKKEFLEKFVLLQNAESYSLQEQFLYKWWSSYATINYNRKVAGWQGVLDKFDNKFGFADGNIRILWLTLSLATPDYKPSESYARYQELIGYTDPTQPFQLRQNAFKYLQQLNSFENKSMRNLIEACVHHTWRFRENARSIFKEIMKDDRLRNAVQEMQVELPEKQKQYLMKTL